MKNILVVGSLNIDMVINAPYVPKMGETIHGQGFQVICGGKGANQAVAAARLGCQVKMIGCVGRDAYGTTLIENLQKNGVDAIGVERSEGFSGTAMITVVGGDNFIILDKGANALVTCQVIERHRDAFEWADIVVFQFEIPSRTILYAAKIAHEYGAKVVLNPAPATTIDKELLRYVDIIIPNQREAEALLGYRLVKQEDFEKAVIDVKGMGIPQVIITLGAQGCIYNSAGEIKHQPALPVHVVDTTAAGDSFIGGFCTALCDGKNIDEAVAYATKVASITVGKKGAATSLPTKAMVEREG